jgi:hypothetical protein
MMVGLGYFGDARREKKGAQLLAQLRKHGLCSVRRLGETRSGQIGLHRFLHSASVSVEEMAGSARSALLPRVAGRRILAIQDTTEVQVEDDRHSLCLHPVIALDAAGGAFWAWRASSSSGVGRRTGAG